MILHEDTVKSTTPHICQVFRINGFNNPGSGKIRVTSLKLTRIFDSYKKKTKSKILEANYVSTTFLSQKYLEKNQSTIQHKCNQTLCSIRAWGTLINLILSYQHTNGNTSINFFEDKNSPSFITADDMIKQILTACQTMGITKLGFTSDRTRTY